MRRAHVANTISRSAHRAGVSGAIWISGGRGELMARDVRQCLAVCPEPSRPGLSSQTVIDFADLAG
jgi:hypothetical protein